MRDARFGFSFGSAAHGPPQTIDITSDTETDHAEHMALQCWTGHNEAESELRGQRTAAGLMLSLRADESDEELMGSAMLLTTRPRAHTDMPSDSDVEPLSVGGEVDVEDTAVPAGEVGNDDAEHAAVSEPAEKRPRCSR